MMASKAIQDLIKIGEIIDTLDRYDDYVDDTHSHGVWIDRQEEALDRIIEIIEGYSDE